MHKKFVLGYILLALTLLTCKKVTEEPNLPPNAFTVSVVREATSARLFFSNFSDPNGDDLSFTIELDGQRLVTGLQDDNFRIAELPATKKYKGKVTLTDSKGLSHSENFEINIHTVLLVRGPQYGSLSAFDLTGHTIWTSVDAAVSTPAVSNDTVFLADDKNLNALRLSDGNVIWKQPIIAKYNRGVMYHKGVLYVEHQGKLSAINSTDGSIIWSIACETTREFSIGNETLYMMDISPTKKSQVNAIDLKTGITKWSSVIATTVNSKIIAKDNMVYFVGSTTKSQPSFLFALDALTGNQKWSYSFAGESLNTEESGAPIIAGNLVYVPSFQELPTRHTILIHAVNKENGALVWKEEILTAERVDALAIDATALYTCSNFYIFKINPINGAVIWYNGGYLFSRMTLTNQQIFTPGNYKLFSYEFNHLQWKEIISSEVTPHYAPTVVTAQKVYYASNSAMSVKN